MRFWAALLGLLLSMLAWVGCYNPFLPMTPTDVKERTLLAFPALKDTSQIGLISVAQDTHNRWYVAYNHAQTAPKVYLYHIQRPDEPAHEILLTHKQEAAIERVFFEDITQDGEYELMIELHYDYDVAYQGRELMAFQHPFDTTGKTKEIFAFPYEQAWMRIDSFDQEYGMPTQRRRVENHATIQFYEDVILMRGTIYFRKNHLVKYKWDKALQEFIKEADEEEQRISEEDALRARSRRASGSKTLMEVIAHEDHCRAFVVEDAAGQPIELPEEVFESLHCSKTTSLGFGGRYLIYCDEHLHKLQLFDFETKKIQTMLDHTHTYEGISEPAWLQLNNTRRIALIVVNPEEYLYNSRIFIYTLDANGALRLQSFDQKAWYQCSERTGCVPEKDYDYRFNNVGNFVFRHAKTGVDSRDFHTLTIPSDRPAPKPKPKKKGK